MSENIRGCPTKKIISEEQDPNFSIYFMDFINEAARVIKERKEREEAS